MNKSLRFTPYVFIAFFLLVIFCFKQSYFGHIPDFKNVISPIGNVPIEITAITHFHALLLVTWLLLLIVQPILIITGRTRLHHMLGKASYVLMALIVISVVLIIRQEQLRHKVLPVFAVNLFDMPVFFVFYCLAIYYRKNSAYHSRFMIMTIVPLMSPVLARVHGPGIPVQIALWAIFFIVEAFNRKVFKPYLIGFAYYLINFAVVAYMFFGNPKLLEGLWGFFFA